MNEIYVNGINIKDEQLDELISILVNKNINVRDKDFLVRTINYFYQGIFGNYNQLKKFVSSNSFATNFSEMIKKMNKKIGAFNWNNNGHWRKNDTSSSIFNGESISDEVLCEFFKHSLRKTSKEEIETALDRGDLHTFYLDGESSLSIAIFYNEKDISERKIIVKGVRSVKEIPKVKKVILAKCNDSNLIMDFTDIDKAIDESIIEYIFFKDLNGEPLSKDDLSYLYSISSDSVANNRSVISDRRIYNILENRNQDEDLAYIFDCSIEQVCTNCGELEPDVLVYYDEEAIKDIDCFPIEISKDEPQNLPKYFIGILDLGDYDRADNLKLPEHFVGKLDLSGLVSAEGLKLPKYFSGELDLSGLESAHGLVLPENFNGTLKLDSLKSLDEFVFPNNFAGTLDLSGLEVLENYKFPETFNGTLIIDGLINAKNVIFPKVTTGSVSCRYLEKVENVIFPQYVGDSFTMWNLEKIINSYLPKTIVKSFYWSGHSLIDVEMPEYVGGYFTLKDFVKAKNVTLPRHLPGGVAELSGLVEAHGVVFPSHFDGELLIDDLISFRGVKLPETGDCSIRIMYKDFLTLEQMREFQQHEIDGYTKIGHEYDIAIVDESCNIVYGNLRKLSELENLNGDLIWHGSDRIENVIIDVELSGNCYFKNLNYIHNLTITESLEGDIYMDELSEASGLIFPHEFNHNIHLNSLQSLKGVALPQKGLCEVFYHGIGYSLDIINKIQKNEQAHINEKEETPRFDALNMSEDGTYKFFDFNDLENSLILSGKLIWQGSDTVVEFVLPSRIDCDLYFPKLKAVSKMDLSRYDNFDNESKQKYRIISLRDLIFLETLIFPEYFYGTVELTSLKKLDGIVFPKSGDCTFYYKDKEYTLEEIKAEQRKTSNTFDNNSLEYDNPAKEKNLGFVNNISLITIIILMCIVFLAISLLIIS